MVILFFNCLNDDLVMITACGASGLSCARQNVWPETGCGE